MRFEIFKLNNLIFYQVINPNDVVKLEMTNVGTNFEKIVFPLITTINSQYFIARIVSVDQQINEDLNDAKIFIDQTGFFNYKLLVNDVEIESGQISVYGVNLSQTTTVGDIPNTTIILPGLSGSSGTSGVSGASGSSGVSGIGLSTKASTVEFNEFTNNTNYYTYNVVFTEPFPDLDYTITLNYDTIANDNILVHSQNKTINGFDIILSGALSNPNDKIYYVAVAYGESSISGTSGTSGFSGTSGIDGVSGTSGVDGLNGSSGTSAGGGGGTVADTRLSQFVGLTSTQVTLPGNNHQWHSLYGDGALLDFGRGATQNREVGYILPFELAPGEKLSKIGFYTVEPSSSGTAEVKFIVMDKHPQAFLPNNLLYNETLTWAITGNNHKFVSYDVNFTNTATINQTFFAWLLLPATPTYDYDIVRTLITPGYLTYDYRHLGGFAFDNRFTKTNHWITDFTSVYNNLPSTFVPILEGVATNIASNAFMFRYNEDRGGHLYYQTERD